MSSWKVVKLESILLPDKYSSIGGPFGSHLTSKDYIESSDFPVIRGNNFNVGSRFFEDTNFVFVSHSKAQELIKHSAYPGDLIFTQRGTIGQVAIIPFCTNYPRYILSQNLMKISIDKNKADLRFIYYYFVSPNTQKTIENNVIGSTIPGFNLTQLRDFNIILPSLDKQQKIAAVLSALDAKIEVNNRINAELESLAKTIYDYWFVQFDFPNEDGKPYKASGGEMVYHPELKREIPAGWEVKELGKVLKTNLGGTPSTKDLNYWNNGNIPWLNSGEIANFPVTISEKFITQEGLKNSPAELLPKGSIVISIVRYIRPSILAIDACANQSVLGIYESNQFLNCYIYPYLVSQVPRLMGLRTGAQQPHINKEIVDTSPFIIPESQVLSNYYKITKPIFSQIINIAFQNQQLTQLRDWLLPLLMNGQITIK